MSWLMRLRTLSAEASVFSEAAFEKRAQQERTAVLDILVFDCPADSGCTDVQLQGQTVHGHGDQAAAVEEEIGLAVQDRLYDLYDGCPSALNRSHDQSGTFKFGAEILPELRIGSSLHHVDIVVVVGIFPHL